MSLEIKLAYDNLPAAVELFLEYRTSLGTDLCFKNFEQELNALPARYVLPDGRLYLAYMDGKLAGCIALRRFDEHTGELKRLYVRPEFRKLNIGYKLVRQIISDAKNIGYKFIFLDTLQTMQVAFELYKSIGFETIAPYYDSSIKETHYLKYNLLAND